MLAADPLRLETNPFAGGASGARIGRPLQAAFGEVIRQIGLEAPVVVVGGGAGTGKTLLMSMIARAGTDMGLWVRQIDRGDLMPATFDRCADALLIDEADSMADSTLQKLVSAGRKTAATTIVFLCLPSNVPRFAPPESRAVTVELTALTESDARLYLLERAASAGRPDLFAPDALDLVLDGSRGAPRMLRSIASLAFFNAALEGVPQIGAKHVADALASQIPGGAAVDNAAPIETPAHDVAPTVSVSDPALRPVDAEPAPAWDPPLRSESLIAEARAGYGAQPQFALWLPRLIGAAALAASIAIAAAIPLLMNGMAGSANASKSRPAAPLVIPREPGFASVIPVSPPVFPKPVANGADIATALKAAGEIATPPKAPAKSDASAGEEAKAAKEAAYLRNAIEARAQAAKEEAYRMNARAAAEAAAQAASVQESAVLPQETAAPAQAANRESMRAPSNSLRGVAR